MRLKAEWNGLYFEINYEYPLAGSFLDVYKDGENIGEDSQDTIKDTMEVALEEYGVPFEAWGEF